MMQSHLRETLANIRRSADSIWRSLFPWKGSTLPRQLRTGSRRIVAASGRAHARKRTVEHRFRRPLERRSISRHPEWLPRRSAMRGARAHPAHAGGRKPSSGGESGDRCRSRSARPRCKPGDTLEAHHGARAEIARSLSAGRARACAGKPLFREIECLRLSGSSSFSVASSPAT